MKFKFEWVCDKHGWKVLIIDVASQQLNASLWLTDQEALELYKFIGANFDVESVDG